MIDRDEHRGLAFAGDRRCQVGAPHRIDRVRDDGAVVMARPPRRAGPRRRKQAVLPHLPQHPAQRGAGPRVTQSCPDLAMPLAMERAGGKHPRIALVSASSDIAPRGPRHCAIGGAEVDRWRYTTERASRHTRQTAAGPYGLPMTSDMTRLMACAPDVSSRKRG
jgi:hypothetical protein